MTATVRTWGRQLPAIADRLLALYLDRCPAAPFRTGLLWRDQWRGGFGMVQTFGVDVAGLRLRLVIEAAPPAG